MTTLTKIEGETYSCLGQKWVASGVIPEGALMVKAVVTAKVSYYLILCVGYKHTGNGKITYQPVTDDNVEIVEWK